MPLLVGKAANQVPVNGMLGTMAFRDAELFGTMAAQNADNVAILGGSAVLSTAQVASLNATSFTSGLAVLTTAQVSALTATSAALTTAQISMLGAGLAPVARNNTAMQTVNGLGFPATPVPSTDPNTLDVYVEGTFTATMQGCTTTPTATFSYVRIGRVVTLTTAPMSGTTSSANIYVSISGFPSIIHPGTAVSCLLPARHLAAGALAKLDIGAGGSVTLSNFPTTNYTSGQDVGTYAVSVTYPV
jgi:hypothetical protein